MQQWWLQLHVYIDDCVAHLCGRTTHSVPHNLNLNHDLANSLELSNEHYLQLVNDVPTQYATTYQDLLDSYTALSNYCPGFMRRDIALELNHLARLLQRLCIDDEPEPELEQTILTKITQLEQSVTDAIMIVYYLRFMDRTVYPELLHMTDWNWYWSKFPRAHNRLLNSVRALQDLTVECILCLQNVALTQRQIGYATNQADKEFSLEQYHLKYSELYQCAKNLRSEVNRAVPLPVRFIKNFSSRIQIAGRWIAREDK